jgi:hypothetical protein
LLRYSVGKHHMVEHRTRFSSYDPDPDGFDGDFTNDAAQPAPYRFGHSTQDDYVHEPSVPLFLSDPDGEPYPEEFVSPLRRGRMASVSSKILLTVVAASGAAMLYAWFSSDATRDIILNAKASIAAAMPAPSATATAEAAQLTSDDQQIKPLLAKAPAPVGASPVQPQAAAPAQTPPSPVVVANITPSREEIANAYQNALQAHAPVAVAAPVAPTAAPVAPAPAPTLAPKRIDAQELATLMKRAKDMLAMGDIPAARLLLERAAEGQDATAALMLARTYDPAVLGTADVRNITPEPDKARAWYQKAAQLGSTEAQRRLAQLPN